MEVYDSRNKLESFVLSLCLQDAEKSLLGDQPCLIEKIPAQDPPWQ